MPAAAIVLPLAETFGLAQLGITAGGIGASTLSAAGLGAIASNTIVASTVGGAIMGAGQAALNAAIQGGDIGKAAATGALTGGVGSGVSQYVGSEATRLLGGGPAGGPGMSAVPPSIAGSPTAGLGATGGLAGLAGGTAAALATGSPLEQALQTGLRSGATGAVSGLLSGAAQYGLGLPSKEAQLIGQAGGELTKYATTPRPSISYPTYQATSREAAPPTMTGGRNLASAGGPSATLGQSLSIAPTLGYSPGGTVFGVGGEGDTPKRRVWNVASLRNIGEEV